MCQSGIGPFNSSPPAPSRERFRTTSTTTGASWRGPGKAQFASPVSPLDASARGRGTKKTAKTSEDLPMIHHVSGSGCSLFVLSPSQRRALAHRHHELRGGGGDNAQLNAGKCREQIPSHPITFGKYTFSLASIKPRCIPIDVSFPTLSNSSWGLDLFPSPPPSCLRPLAACGLQRKPGISGSALTDLSLLQETKNSCRGCSRGPQSRGRYGQPGLVNQM
ncbi:hypothetical protein CCUS01_14344 [Colletotrichum cuscutae]|uniref:Uncharacterized protein n=1 Tax=Colletotrichum cuscutae TaxID=1209917 RepID=A0AAI9Y9B4_9PEZI|nr:hypothetical protein CCUS01_14344 [Colletotrichum cuscutae]